MTRKRSEVRFFYHPSHIRDSVKYRVSCFLLTENLSPLTVSAHKNTPGVFPGASCRYSCSVLPMSSLRGLSRRLLLLGGYERLGGALLALRRSVLSMCKISALPGYCFAHGKPSSPHNFSAQKYPRCFSGGILSLLLLCAARVIPAWPVPAASPSRRI